MTEHAINVASRVLVAPNVYARAFGSELVLLDFARGDYYALDAVGALIWASLARGTPIATAAAAVAARYRIADADAVRDTVALVADLERCGLVTIAP